MTKPEKSLEKLVSTSAVPKQGRLLLIEHEPEIQSLISDHFCDMGYDVISASDGEAGIRAAFDERPDALLLDVMLPGMDGFSVCRHIRDRNPNLPILILTSRDEVADKVLGLEMGADDYITKPFNLRELEARVKSIMRRVKTRIGSNRESEQAPIIRGNLRIDLTRREVTVAGRRADLTPREFELLSLFAAHPGRVYSRKFLLENLWDYTYSGYDRTIDSHINRLRIKIEENPNEPKMVVTVWGVGYKFAEENED